MTHDSEDHGETLTHRSVQVEGLAKSIHHAGVLIHQRHRQTVNSPSFLVRADSEKHIDFALTYRARRSKRTSSAKRFQTELEAVRRTFRIDEEALSNLQVDNLSRGGDTAQPFRNRRPGRVKRKKQNSCAAAVTMARMKIKLAHDLQDETLRVSKEHEDELLKSLPRQQSLREHKDAKLHQETENQSRTCTRCTRISSIAL